MEMVISFPGGKKVDASYKGFTIKTDQSKAAGGEGTAPTPFDLFLASIGTCAGYFVLSFCQERGIPIGNAKLRLQTERIRETGILGMIIIDIDLPQDFPDKYKRAVKSVVDQCTVKKSIVKAPDFDIRVNIG